MAWLLGPYSQHFIFFVTYECAHKLVCLSLVSVSGLVWSNTLAFWAQKLQRKQSLVNMAWLLGSYSQHFFFFVAYKCVHKLVCLSLASLSGLVWSNTLAFWAQKLQRKQFFEYSLAPGTVFKTLYTFRNLRVFPLASVFDPCKSFWPSVEQHSSLFGTKVTKKTKFCEYGLAPGIVFTTLFFLRSLQVCP